MIKPKFNLLKLAAGAFLTFQIISLMVLFALPLPAAAQSSADATIPLNFNPQVQIPNSPFAKTTVPVGTYNAASGTMTSDLLSNYIIAIYNYGLAIAGILATIVLMGGGVLWLVSGGDSGKINQAKELITGSVTGMLILVAAWMILNTVNPNLVNLKAIETTALTKIVLDSDDGIIDNVKNIPSDASVKWTCFTTPGFSCSDDTPPSINLNVEICRQQLGEHASCPIDQIWCCGKSAADQKKANEYCYGRQTGEDCKLTMTSIGIDGYCENNKCNSCKRIGDTCSGGSKNYECIDKLAECGRSSQTADCDCGTLGLGSCTCKATWK